MFVRNGPGEIDSVMFVWTWPGEVNSVMFVWAWPGEVNCDVCVNVTRWEKHCSTTCCSKGITTRLHSMPYRTLFDSLFRKTTLTDACSLLCPTTCKSPTEWAWIGRFLLWTSPHCCSHTLLQSVFISDTTAPETRLNDGPFQWMTMCCAVAQSAFLTAHKALLVRECALDLAQGWPNGPCRLLVLGWRKLSFPFLLLLKGL